MTRTNSFAKGFGFTYPGAALELAPGGRPASCVRRLAVAYRVMPPDAANCRGPTGGENDPVLNFESAVGRRMSADSGFHEPQQAAT